MATLKLSFKEAEGGILFHGFMARVEKTADKMQTGHAAICPSYGPALKAGNTIENTIEIDEIPDFDAEAIDEWVAEMFGLEEDEDEETAEGEEDEEDEEEDEG